MGAEAVDMKSFRPYQPDPTLLPPSIEEWLPVGHLALFVREVVSELDLRGIEDTYEEGPGQPPCHPRLRVTLLLYAYSTGTYSSRRMAAKPSPKAQRDFTDPESPIQKTADGFVQGYTAVLAVDDVAQVVVAQHVTPRAAEVHELLPAVETIERALGERPGQVAADAGYWSEANAEHLEAQGIDTHIARR